MTTTFGARVSRALHAIAFAAAAAAGSAGPGLAQETVPTSGHFAVRYTFFNPTTSAFGVVARGEDAEAGISGAGAWISWLMRDDGSTGFGHKMTGRCTEFFRQGADGFEMVAVDCIYTDADGDRLFEKVDGLSGVWTGGTGKYAGISGGFELTDIVITVESGYEMQSGVKVGSYTIE